VRLGRARQPVTQNCEFMQTTTWPEHMSPGDTDATEHRKRSLRVPNKHLCAFAFTACSYNTDPNRKVFVTHSLNNYILSSPIKMPFLKILLLFIFLLIIIMSKINVSFFSTTWLQNHIEVANFQWIISIKIENKNYYYYYYYLHILYSLLRNLNYF